MLSTLDDTLLPPLLKMVRIREVGAAVPAANALVNLAQQPATRSKLIELGGIDVSLRAVCATEKASDTDNQKLAHVSCMLLANLTQCEAAVTELVEHERTSTVLDLFAKADANDLRFEQLPAALTQMLAAPAGRSLVLSRQGVAHSLCSCLRQDDGRLAGAALALRNLCFEAGTAASARAGLLLVLEDIILAIAARLHVESAQYDDEDFGKLPLLVQEVVSTPMQPVAESSVRLALTEALVLLTASSEAREAMRRLCIYPVLREAHKAEEAESVKDANEMLVGEFML
uniref:Protein HGH1 homolog n=1 Tax=Coccolithus braarudii TaxID=221442 RepID=A0A7S0PZG6_9EUKA